VAGVRWWPVLARPALDRLPRVDRAAHPAGIVFADVRKVGFGVQGREDIAVSGMGTRGSVGISWISWISWSKRVLGG
jgi:hypothetical protein